jgi:hypothetical protein
MNDSIVNVSTPRTRAPERRQGPPLPVPAAFLVVLTVLSAVLGAPGPRPDDRAATIAAYDLGHHATVTVLAFAVSATSIPLAVWAAVVYRRLRRLGVSAPGAVMAFAGGMLAAAAISVSGTALWVSAEAADISEPMLSRALTLFAFASGGAGFVVPFALMVAGISVPALLLGLLPRPLAAGGLILAVLGMLVSFTLVWSQLYALIPIGRFAMLAWLVAVSFLLPADKRMRAARGAS